MKIFLVSFVCLFVGTFATQDCDVSKCEGFQTLYKELGCKAVVKEGSCCPVKYECPDFTARNKDKCHLNGQEFDVNSELPKALTDKLCVPYCHCVKHDPEAPAKLDCGHYDCPEYFSGLSDPSCVLTYDLDGCCSSGQLCGKEAQEKAAKCYLEGKEYMEGQKMYAEDFSCVCTSSFDNSTLVNNPNCKASACGFEMHYAPKLQKGCVPIYYANNQACPIDWKCPNAEKDQVLKKSLSANDETEHCTFGSLKVAVGDEAATESKETTCKCVVPPFVECVRQKHPNY
ncbi:uncharacterized protein LOC134829248 [Culicoides brevitarsis]|uniref:uncharacterized protein LOC134829248 n=1 Tax=Culicoides brevitarsis TaxID=469753 RepID=UPI00307B7EA6